MRRVLASWASSTLRGAYAESVVDLNVLRCFATESGPSVPGKQHRLMLKSFKRGSKENGA